MEFTVHSGARALARPPGVGDNDDAEKDATSIRKRVGPMENAILAGRKLPGVTVPHGYSMEATWRLRVIVSINIETGFVIAERHVSRRETPLVATLVAQRGPKRDGLPLGELQNPNSNGEKVNYLSRFFFCRLFLSPDLLFLSCFPLKICQITSSRPPDAHARLITPSNNINERSRKFTRRYRCG